VTYSIEPHIYYNSNLGFTVNDCVLSLKPIDYVCEALKTFSIE
jgi:hypothetical protein